MYREAQWNLKGTDMVRVHWGYLVSLNLFPACAHRGLPTHHRTWKPHPRKHTKSASCRAWYVPGIQTHSEGYRQLSGRRDANSSVCRATNRLNLRVAGATPEAALLFLPALRIFSQYYTSMAKRIVNLLSNCLHFLPRLPWSQRT
jgi:hypothetical protein